MKKQEERRLSMSGLFDQARASPTFLPIALEGGIGDAILSRLTLQVLSDWGLQPIVWSVHHEALSYFGQRVQPGIIPRFYWHLRLDPMPKFVFAEEFGGFALPGHLDLFEGHKTWMHDNGLLGHLTRIHSENKWKLADLAVAEGFNAETLPPLALGLGKHERIPAMTRDYSEEYITIHDGFDAQVPVSGRSTKQWEWRQWNQLVARLKKEYPHIKIRQLGTLVGRAIDGVDDLLLGKTTITQAFDILSKSRLHIDTDSGLAHAATKMGVPCVVLFGPTPKYFYGHPENENLFSDEICPGNCFWLTKTWMDRCPILYPTPRCMDDITVDQVLDAVQLLLW